MIYVNILKKLNNFTLDVNFQGENEILGLLGPSGSGKSLTLKCIAGIETPDSGKIILNGKTLFDSEKNINLKPQERNIGYLFQDYALFPNMTVYENICVGVKQKNKENTVNEIIEELELKGLENKKPSTLSGGEKQRVALGRILVTQPEILLLDEPFSALDDYLKWKIELEIKSIIEKHKIPSIFVSHSKDEVYRMCQSISVLNNGKSEEKMNTKDLFENPKTISQGLLSGIKNFSKIEILDSKNIFAKDWGLKIEKSITDDYKYIGLRDSFVEIIDFEDLNSFKINKFEEIEEISSTILIIETPNNSIIRAEIDKVKWKELKNKKDLYVRILEENIMLLK